MFAAVVFGKSHAVHVAQACLGSASVMLAIDQCSRSVLAPNSARTLRGVVGLLGAAPERMRLDGAFDQPPRRVIPQTGFVVNRNGAGDSAPDKASAGPPTF